MKYKYGMTLFMFSEEDEKVVLFLETLLLKYKNNLLTDEEKRELHSFYRTSLYNKKEKNENEEENMLDYLSLGWYIHTFLLNR